MWITTHIHASKHGVTTVYPKKYAHGFVVLCFVVVMQSFIMNSHEVFIHIHQSCFAGTGTIVRLPQCQWSKPDGYGKISQWITTTKHSKAKTVCIFLGIYCNKTIVIQQWCHRLRYVSRGCKWQSLWTLYKCSEWNRLHKLNSIHRWFVQHWRGYTVLCILAIPQS